MDAVEDELGPVSFFIYSVDCYEVAESLLQWWNIRLVFGVFSCQRGIKDLLVVFGKVAWRSFT